MLSAIVEIQLVLIHQGLNVVIHGDEKWGSKGKWSKFG